MLKLLSVYYEKNILKICLYGFMSGMGVLLSSSTINFWLASFGIDAKIIGLFSCIAIPYAFKYFIAAWINHHQFIWFAKKIGNHKAWLIFSSIMIILALIITSFLNPLENLWLIALAGFFMALFTVIQDIILNANRIKILNEDLQPTGTAIYIVGYRLGMLFSGAGTIFSSNYMSWQAIYLIMTIIYLAMTIAIIYLFKESITTNLDIKNNSYYNIFIRPLQNFLELKYFIWVAGFIIMYRLSDNMLHIMLNPFLLHLNYNAIEIAGISKFFGIIMVIIGGIISGPIISKFKIRNSILSFSIIHTFSHLLFILLIFTGKNIILLYLVTASEALTGGMMMTVYISFISSLCKGKDATSQYALLSSGIGLSRVIFPSFSGIIVDDWGWLTFFISIIIISIITIAFVHLIPKRLFTSQLPHKNNF